METTAIGRRIEKAVFSLKMEDIESTLVNVFPAIDKTATKRFPKCGVGKRIRAYISDEEGIISLMGTGSIIRGTKADGISLADAMYKYGRTSITHEGELDPRLKFTNGDETRIGDTWELNLGYAFGMILAVILSPENEADRSPADYTFTLFKNSFSLNRMWGRRADFVNLVRNEWEDHSLVI